MNTQQPKNIETEIANLKESLRQQTNTLTLLLGVAKAAKISRPDIEKGVDSLKLPQVRAEEKQEAKKLIPFFFS
jgi:hypothetical protein